MAATDAFQHPTDAFQHSPTVSMAATDAFQHPTDAFQRSTDAFQHPTDFFASPEAFFGALPLLKKHINNAFQAFPTLVGGIGLSFLALLAATQSRFCWAGAPITSFILL